MPAKAQDIVTLYVTFENESDALAVTRTLIEERLIACANILPPGRSVYAWDGQIVDEPEVYALLKSTKVRAKEVIERIEELHSYDTACIGVWPWVDGLDAYARWVGEETQS